MIISIKNLEIFSTFLSSVQKIAAGELGGSIFLLDEKGVKVNVRNENETIRCYFESDCIYGEKPFSFAFRDIGKLLKSINLIREVEDLTSANIDFTGTFLSYDNKIKFKLKVVKPEVIEKYVTPEIKADLIATYSFKTTSEKIKRVLNCTSIITSPDAKIYFSKQNDLIIAEVDDKSNQMFDSVGIPISDQITGEVSKVVAASMDNFRDFIVLPSDDIEIKIIADKNAFDVYSKLVTPESFIKVRMVAAFKKA